jgi:hypothetical protein
LGVPVRALTLDPRGVKFLSTADVLLERMEGTRTFRGIPCIDEYVVFARQRP